MGWGFSATRTVTVMANAASDPDHNDPAVKSAKALAWLKIHEQAITELRAKVAFLEECLKVKPKAKETLRPGEALRRIGRRSA